MKNSKIKSAKCSICKQSFYIKKLKEHILNSHMKYSLDLVVKEFVSQKIYDFKDNEINLIEKAYKSYNNNSDSINIFLLEIKMKHFEQNITRLMQTSNVNQIEHEYFHFSVFIEKLNENLGIGSPLKIKIDETLTKVKNIYSGKITKQEYYLKTDVCIFCNKRIFKSAIIDHLLKSHFRERSKNLESAIIYYKQKLDNEQHNFLSNIKERERKVTEQELIANINSRYFSIEDKIKALGEADYMEVLDSQIDLIKQQLMNLLKNRKYNELEVFKNNSLMKKLQNINKILPTKENFIKDFCQKLYITWDDIHFEKNKICISPNKGFVHPIPLNGSLPILNEIKVDYFRRVYKNDVFKLIIKNGYVRQDLSKDLIKIEEQIFDYTKETQAVKNIQTQKHESIFRTTSEKNEILEYINTQSLKNGFLRYPATLLNQNDNVIALLENNNGIEEESLLFIFRRDNYSYLLWENINSKRAAYFFCFDSKSMDISISKTAQLIITNSEYKRENLFRAVDIKKVYNIDCIFYRSIVHENQGDYKKQLDRIFKLPTRPLV